MKDKIVLVKTFLKYGRKPNYVAKECFLLRYSSKEYPAIGHLRGKLEKKLKAWTDKRNEEISRNPSRFTEPQISTGIIFIDSEKGDVIAECLKTDFPEVEKVPTINVWLSIS